MSPDCLWNVSGQLSNYVVWLCVPQTKPGGGTATREVRGSLWTISHADARNRSRTSSRNPVFQRHQVVSHQPCVLQVQWSSFNLLAEERLVEGASKCGQGVDRSPIFLSTLSSSRGGWHILIGHFYGTFHGTFWWNIWRDIMIAFDDCLWQFMTVDDHWWPLMTFNDRWWPLMTFYMVMMIMGWPYDRFFCLLYKKLLQGL